MTTPRQVEWSHSAPPLVAQVLRNPDAKKFRFTWYVEVLGERVSSGRSTSRETAFADAWNAVLAVKRSREVPDNWSPSDAD